MISVQSYRGVIKWRAAPRAASYARRDPLQTVLATMVAGACRWATGEDENAMQRELKADRAVIDAGCRAALARAMVKLLAQPH